MSIPGPRRRPPGFLRRTYLGRNGPRTGRRAGVLGGLDLGEEVANLSLQTFGFRRKRVGERFYVVGG
jgi:hypothetical protein